MKQLEDEVISFLRPAILEAPQLRMSRKQERSLVGWISLLICLAEWSSVTTKAITKDELFYLKRTRVPPENWNVFIAKCDGIDWMKRYQYHNFILQNRSSIIPGPLIRDRLAERDAQITTTGIGNILFQVFSSNDPAALFSHQSFARDAGMVQIWPERGIFPFLRKGAVLPPDVALDDREAYKAANAFREIIYILYNGQPPPHP